jgi:hypothetical protein
MRVDGASRLADAGGLAARPGPALQALHARLLRDRSLQFDVSNVAPTRPWREPAWLRDLAGALARVLGPLLPALKLLFWVGVAAAILLVVWLMARDLVAARLGWRRRARPVRAAPADWAPDTRRARALLENADRLAAQGRFDQAVRLILHRSIDDIETRRPRLVRPALTARDIAGLEALPARARAAFARMAAIVEFSAFAGQPIGQAAFAQCREAYAAFAFPEVWR